MAVTSTTRFGLAQWSSGIDPYRRTQIHDSLGNIEARAAGHLQGTVLPSPGPEFEGFFFFDISANELYYCDGSQWWSVAGAEGGFGSPSSLQVSDTVGADGTATSAARSNHIHGMAGFDSPVPVSTALGAGSGETVARADHRHSLSDGSIDTANQFVAGVVGTPSLAPEAVTNVKLATSAVTGIKVSGEAVATSKYQDGSVTEPKLADGAATGDKIGDVDTSKFTTGTLGVARIPNLDASQVTTGTIDSARIPDSVITPPGMVVMHSSTTSPETGEWLLCDGSAVSRTTYADLDAALSAAGYPFGNGDGSTTFNVPNLTERMPLGLRSSGTGSAVGDTAGTFNHVHTNPSHGHSVDFPNANTSSSGSHAHTNSSTGSVGNHAHATGTTNGTIVGSAEGSDGASGIVSRDDITHSHSHSHGDGSYFLGSGGSASHTHGVTGTSNSSSPSYTGPDRSHDHSHPMPSTGSDGGHAHSFGNTGSAGSHSHSVNIPSFQTSNAGTGNTGSANPPFLALTFWIKT